MGVQLNEDSGVLFIDDIFLTKSKVRQNKVSDICDLRKTTYFNNEAEHSMKA